jgi:hypothetical protein
MLRMLPKHAWSQASGPITSQQFGHRARELYGCVGGPLWNCLWPIRSSFKLFQIFCNRLCFDILRIWQHVEDVRCTVQRFRAESSKSVLCPEPTWLKNHGFYTILKQLANLNLDFRPKLTSQIIISYTFSWDCPYDPIPKSNNFFLRYILRMQSPKLKIIYASQICVKPFWLWYCINFKYKKNTIFKTKTAKNGVKL